MITHKKYEDMFYDPLECRPFYKDKDAPIWYGRVEGLSTVNQKLFVYGFITSNEDTGRTHFRYSMQVRGKNSDQEMWYYYNEDEPYRRHRFRCDKDKDDQPCSYWRVGTVPIIEYEMYDIAIIVEPSDEMAELDETSLNFHIAYVNPDFTAYQIFFRATFAMASLLILCLYSTKVLCRLSAKMQKQLTFE